MSALGDTLRPLAEVLDALHLRWFVFGAQAVAIQDLDDVRSLLAGGEGDVTEARDLLTQLEDALGQSDLLPRLDEALTARGARLSPAARLGDRR